MKSEEVSGSENRLGNRVKSEKQGREWENRVKSEEQIQTQETEVNKQNKVKMRVNRRSTLSYNKTETDKKRGYTTKGNGTR